MWRSFSRSQIAAVCATLLDYGILLSWVEILHLHYYYGVALGAAFGAIANFLFNRHLSFESTDEHWQIQARRYAVVSAGSLALNTCGVFLITDFVGVHYFISQILISIFVGVLYNFPLHRYYVYKKKEASHEQTIHLPTPQSEN